MNAGLDQDHWLPRSSRSFGRKGLTLSSNQQWEVAPFSALAKTLILYQGRSLSQTFAYSSFSVAGGFPVIGFSACVSHSGALGGLILRHDSYGLVGSTSEDRHGTFSICHRIYGSIQRERDAFPIYWFFRIRGSHLMYHNTRSTKSHEPTRTMTLRITRDNGMVRLGCYLRVLSQARHWRAALRV